MRVAQLAHRVAAGANGLPHFVTFLVQRVDPAAFSTTFTHGQTGRGEIRQASQSRHHSRLKYMPMLTFRHHGPVWQAEAGAALSH